MNKLLGSNDIRIILTSVEPLYLHEATLLLFSFFQN